MRVAAFASMKRGLEHFIHRELRHLASRGASIVLCPTKQGQGPYEPEDSWQVLTWTLPAVVAAQPRQVATSPRKYLTALRSAITMRAVPDFALAAFFALRLHNIDVLYATFGDRKLFVAYFVKQLTGAPLVVELHAYELYQNPNPALLPTALAACDGIITISEHNREVLRDKFGIDPSRVELVRYIVDLDDYRPQTKFVVLIVAFFVERKGHETLLRAVQSLGDPNMEVWVVGDEGAEDRSVDVYALVRDLGLEEQVAFFGRLSGPALKAVYRACDVFCLPCCVDSQGIAEGFPNAIIEAMSFAKPVISTKHVEIPRVLPRMLVDEGDVEQLAHALATVRDDEGLRQELGRDNRRLAESVFSPANSEQTALVLRRVIASSS